jgi:hypothetical protein
MAAAMSTVVLTVGNTATVGNASLQGTFSANVLSSQIITGQGNVSVQSANLIISSTASLQTVGTAHISGSMIIDTISNVQIPGSSNNVNFLCANPATGNLFFAEVLIPIGQLTNVTDTDANTKTNQSILLWNPNTSSWSVNTLAWIYQTHIGNLAVDNVTSALLVSNTATIGNTLFVTIGKVGVNTNTPRTALDVNGTIYATGDISSFQTSDRSQKELDEEIDPLVAYALLKQSRPVRFRWKEEGKSIYRSPNAVGWDDGLIAQEWEKLFPKHIFTRPDGTKAIDYTKAIPYLIAAIKYLGQKVEQKYGNEDSY